MSRDSDWNDDEPWNVPVPCETKGCPEMLDTWESAFCYTCRCRALEIQADRNAAARREQEAERRAS